MKYHGSCHCQKVKFEVQGEFKEGISCNCSMCGRKGTVLAFVPREQLTIISGEDNLTDYQFGSKSIHHTFCSTCGVTAFATGQQPDSPLMAAINLRCLDEVNLDEVQIKKVNGKDF